MVVGRAVAGRRVAARSYAAGNARAARCAAQETWSGRRSLGKPTAVPCRPSRIASTIGREQPELEGAAQVAAVDPLGGRCLADRGVAAVVQQPLVPERSRQDLDQRRIRATAPAPQCPAAPASPPSSAPAAADLVSGRLDLMFTPVVETIQQVRSAQVRALGTTRRERSAELPDVPAVGEALPGYVFTSWLGLFAPAGTPAPAVARIAREVAAALRTGPTREQLEQLGYEPVGSTPEAFAASFAAELPRVAELVRISGVSVD
jgi:Tripartite tricarboxylate transporter family receptor